MTKYKIRVNDIYHQGYEDDFYYIDKEFFSYKQAEKFCYNYWIFHGEVLYISPSKEKKCFDSREYIESKIEKHFNN